MFVVFYGNSGANIYYHTSTITYTRVYNDSPTFGSRSLTTAVTHFEESTRTGTWFMWVTAVFGPGWKPTSFIHLQSSTVTNLVMAVLTHTSSRLTLKNYGDIANSERTLTVSRLGEVHISVSQGSSRDHVPAHADGQHRSGRAELLVQHSLRDVRVQVAHVQRSHGITAAGRVHISDFSKKKKKNAAEDSLKNNKNKITKEPMSFSSPVNDRWVLNAVAWQRCQNLERKKKN